MGDFHDYNLEASIHIKQEPINESNIMITSASVPIPSRRDPPEYRDYIYEIDNSQSPLFGTIGLTTDQVLSPTNTYDVSSNFWGNRIITNDETLKSEALIHMDEDDIFQVDKADLIQGPTLAELNANDENFLGDLNFDDLLLPNESSYTNLDTAPSYNNYGSHFTNNNQMIGASSSCPQERKTTTAKVQVGRSILKSHRKLVERLKEESDNSFQDSRPTKKITFTGLMFYKDLNLPPLVTTANYDVNSRTPISALSPSSPASSSSSVVNSQSSPMHIQNLPPKHSTLHELLMKKDKFESSPDGSLLGQSVPSRNTPLHSPNVKMYRSSTSRLSSSAPTHLGLEQIWQRREPRKHLLSTSSMAECGSTSSLSTGGILSPDPQDFSHDEYESDEDSDAHYEDYSSDNSDDEDEHTKSSKREKYFWQYNIQSKGPKGQRLVMKCKLEDPHVLNEATDPVFSPDCSVRGIKHSGKNPYVHGGKARKGDGNDLTPNPRKLFNIGKELDKLGRIISDMTPVSELPFNVRPNSRKEKNKLASRACRLKKKAQHEANKIKLNGLEYEHRRYINTISQIKQLVAAKLNEPNPETQDEISHNIEKMAKTCTKGKVAGHTTEYVNKVLDKIKAGSSGNTALSTSFPEDL